MQITGCFLLHIEMRVHGVQRRVLMTMGEETDAKEIVEREREGGESVRESEREKERREKSRRKTGTADRPQTSPLHLQVHGIRAKCPRTTTDRGSACTRRVSSVPAAADRDRVS